MENQRRTVAPRRLLVGDELRRDAPGLLAGRQSDTRDYPAVKKGLQNSTETEPLKTEVKFGRRHEKHWGKRASFPSNRSK